uniref:Leucine zipper protein 2 n=1 Tax=Catharus ustulatus TaxID=91951 RepID=A0A8C3U183_CATUS
MPRCPLGMKLRASRRNPSSAAPKGRVLAQPAGRALGWWRRLAVPRDISDGAQTPLGLPFLTPSVCLRWRRQSLFAAGWQLPWPGEDRVGVKTRERDGINSMKFIAAYYVLPLFPALVLGARQSYEELERQLKEVFKERTNILQQLLKTSKELQGIKVNLQSLKNDETSTKKDVHKLLELGQNQRKMKSLQEAFQKQLNEAAEKAEKQQATINFLKTEMERKSKIIRDLQNEIGRVLTAVLNRRFSHFWFCLRQKSMVTQMNKSLKNKLLSGNKLCGIHAEESKKIQAQLKDLHYGKKDLIFKESQLKALKETVELCLSSVLHNQPPTVNVTSSKPAEKLTSSNTKGSKVPFQVASTKVWQNVSLEKENFHVALKKKENQSTQECDSQDIAKTCLGSRNDSTSHLKAAETETSFQKLHSPPWTKTEDKKSPEKNEKKYEESVSTQGKNL